MSETLLAKSPVAGRPPKTLVDHTRDVISCVNFLFGTDDEPTRLGHEWLRFFRMKADDWRPFFVNTLAAAALHDIGKSNDGFQKAVTHSGDQAIRHEHLSGLLISLPDFRWWLQQRSLIDVDVVRAAVISHHLKVDPTMWGQQLGIARTFRVLADTPDFLYLIKMAGSALRLPLEFTPNIPPLWSFDSMPHSFCVGDLLEAEKTAIHRFERLIRKDDPQRQLLLLSVKAALLAADSVGSGVVRVGHALEGWVSNVFGEPLTAMDVHNKVVLPRLRDIEAKSGKPVALQDFQTQAATLGDRALLLAPCGSGKTLAAWLWIEARLKHRPAARVLFLYPTRATATEGFHDYVSWAPEEEAALAHGTASYDLDGMFENPGDSRTEKDFTADDRLYALGLWHKRIFSATVDQFLAFMQNQYGPLCLLPLLADSVVVIDEVHSFDPAMFSALLKYLKHFDGPVLCMTASLTSSRRRTLIEECGLQVFPETLEGLDDLRQKAEHPRYNLQLTSAETVHEILREAFAANKKILWVVNQVRRCQEMAKGLRLPVLCYHSRFKLMDRRSRHRDVVQAFQTGSGPLLAVTTQVCEMSLDLDADVLISEEAPIASLIQRMGRCNRHGKTGDDKVGAVYVYPTENPKPYASEEIAGGRNFLAAFAGKILCQADLEAALEQYAPAQKEPERFSSFLDSGCYAMSYPYRVSEDFTVPAVLDSDIETWLAAKKTGKPADGLVVPVPKRLAKLHTALGRFLRAAPGSHYDPALGFLDSPA